MRHQIRVGLNKQIGKALLVAGDGYYVAAIKAAKKNVNVALCYYEGIIHRGPFNVSDERVRWALHSVKVSGSNGNQLVKVSFGPT